MIEGALQKNARVLAGVFLAWLLGGCAALVPQTDHLARNWPKDAPDRVELTEVPFFPQTEYECGPAALATTLRHRGIDVTPEALSTRVFLPARKGSVQVEMLAAPRAYGLVAYQMRPSFSDLVREVAAGNPVIVLQDYGAWPVKLWHYAVAVGYDADTGHLLLRSGTTERHRMSFALFEYSWQGSAYWAMMALPPDRIPVTAEPARYLSAVAALETARQPQAAATAYRAMLERWPDNAGASIGLANVYHSQGQLAQAEAVLRKAAQVHPADVVILNNLAQTLSDSGKNAEAMKLIERAAALESPHAAAARDTQALIRERLQSGRPR